MSSDFATIGLWEFGLNAGNLENVSQALKSGIEDHKLVGK